MASNKNPISVRDGIVTIDGVTVLDGVSFSCVFTPDVWSGKTLGEKGTNRRWLGYDITGSIKEYRSTPWLREKIKAYLSSGKTPELKLQGIVTDEGSDYFETFGKDSVTLIGCVLTGDISLMDLDTTGDPKQDEIKFGAKSFT